MIGLDDIRQDIFDINKVPKVFYVYRGDTFELDLDLTISSSELNAVVLNCDGLPEATPLTLLESTNVSSKWHLVLNKTLTQILAPKTHNFTITIVRKDGTELTLYKGIMAVNNRVYSNYSSNYYVATLLKQTVPTITDNTYLIGTMWVNILTNRVYFLTSVANDEAHWLDYSDQLDALRNDVTLLDERVDSVENDLTLIDEQVDTHIEDLDNPHGVTAEQVDTYVKTTIDDKDTNTLQQAKEYADSLEPDLSEIEQDILNLHNNKVDKITYDNEKEIIEQDITNLESNKLDKIWNDIASQSLTNLSDEFVLNRGGTVYKTTLANMLSNVVPDDVFIAVSVLPEVGLPNKIYLVPSDDPEAQNTLDEFIWVDNAWERIGGVSVDLDNYYTIPQVDVKLADLLSNSKTYTDNKDAEVLQEAKDYTYEKQAIDNKDANTLQEAKEYADSLEPDLSEIEQDIEEIKEGYVTKASLNLQLLEKQGIRPNGTDLLVIDGKINSVYIDSLYVTDIEVVSTVNEMLSLSNMTRGDIVIVTEDGTTYILQQEPSSIIDNWAMLANKAEVISVNGKTGVVHIGISDIENLQGILNSKLNITTYENDKVIIEQDILDLQNDKVDKTTYENEKAIIEQDIVNLENDKANKIEVYSKTETYNQNEIDNKDQTILQEAKEYAEGLDVDLSEIEQDILSLQNTKVDKVAGKGLSTEDFTSVEKNKLSGIQAGAQVNTVTSVAGKTGAVTLAKDDVGLGSVDNTSDLDKPISTATQTALNTKVDKVEGKQLSTEDFTSADKNLVATIPNKANTTDVNAGLALKVNIAGDVTISGTKNFTGTLLYEGEEVATMQDLSTVFRYKGSVQTYDDLPASGQQIGDVYNVNDTGKNYAWSGTFWDDLGGTVDLSIYATKTELTSGLSGKVDKVAGKGLSTNDYTTAEKTKLSGIATNAQVNVLEGVQLNGTDVAISGKKSNVVINKTTVGLSNVPNVDTTNPANITQNATHRFVSDTEKSTWNGKQNALGFTPENVVNKVTTITASSTNTQYPTAKAVYDMINNAIIASINGGY